jgi:hypothetical protein
VTLLVGVAAFGTHLYIEQDWIWLILALLVIFGALIFWVQDLGNRIQHADGDSTSNSAARLWARARSTPETSGESNRGL